MQIKRHIFIQASPDITVPSKKLNKYFKGYVTHNFPFKTFLE